MLNALLGPSYTCPATGLQFGFPGPQITTPAFIG
uniref:Uncharacterized protein n=1 Tax=Anguilla anguilla TaxID=7936 RepID=A0A0E9RKB1_ANGAN